MPVSDRLRGVQSSAYEPEVTTERTAHDLGSPARPIVRSSADSTHGNNQVIFLLSFSYYHFV
jgi:hypothetical protein